MGKPCAYPGCRTGRRAVRAERTRAGLRQLSDFQVPGALTQCQASQYPEADVQPFLVKSHQYFQDFKQQGFKDIHQARRSRDNINAQCNKHYTTGITTETPSTAVTKDAMDPIQSPEKLRALEAQYRTTVANKFRREREKVRVHSYTTEILNV